MSSVVQELIEKVAEKRPSLRETEIYSALDTIISDIIIILKGDDNLLDRFLGEFDD